MRAAWVWSGARFGVSPTRWSTRKASGRLRWDIFTEWLHPSPEMPRPARAAAEKAFACREAAARLFHVNDPERVVFTFNATHGLNAGISSPSGCTPHRKCSWGSAAPGR